MKGKLVKWDASACKLEVLPLWKRVVNLFRPGHYQARTLTPEGDPTEHPGCVEIIEFSVGGKPETTFRRA